MTKGRISARRRRGAVTLETALTLLVLLSVLLTTLDLGLASFRRNAVHEAARSVARAAIVRGADSETSSWGPDPIAVDADDDVPVAAILRPSIATMPSEDVSLRVEWPDGGNAVGDRVRVTVRYSHSPILPFIYGGAPIDVDASSTMRIVQ